MTINENVIQFVSNIEQGKIDGGAAIQWDKLPPEDRDFLFDQAKKPWADVEKGKKLLHEIYKILDTDIPSKIKLLQQFYVRHDIPAATKKNILSNIKTDLENLRGSVKGANQFNLFSGDYYLLLAREKEDSGNFERALGEYQSAIDFYKKAGAHDRVARVQQEVEQLKARNEKQNTPLPVDILISQRGRLEMEIAELKTQFAKIELQKQAAQNDLTEFNNKKIEFDKIKADIEHLRQQYPYTRATLEFMVILPQIATAPLWVEVLRLALQQGEMDDFSIQALERLAITHPQETIPLLAEIAARAPEPFKIEKQQAQTGITQWFLLIAQARQEIKSEKHLKAAETMVKAWETFFALKVKK